MTKKIVTLALYKDFLEKANKEQKELDEFRKEANRQTKERKKTESERLQDELEPLPWCPMSDE
jgi:hypothetical protein